MRAFIESAKNQLALLYTPLESNRIIRLLLEKWASIDSISFYTDKDRKILPSELKTLQLAIDRLCQHEPLEYVLGASDFAGLTLHVDHRVLIPRPETEELVEWVLHDYQGHETHTPTHILDICTGSGCIILALSKKWPASYLEGWDISAEALEVARLNATENGAMVHFKQIDVLANAPLADETELFDLIVSNPPYVCRSESTCMSANVLEYEPHLALFVEDEDPLIFYSAIARLGKTTLKPGGSLYVEINGLLGEQTKNLFEEQGYSAVFLKKDLFGKDRFVKAKR